MFKPCYKYILALKVMTVKINIKVFLRLMVAIIFNDKTLR